MLTYINIKENGECDVSDGFCSGYFHRLTRETILHHCTESWYDEREVWIGDENDPKAKYVREQWMKIVEEIESGGLKQGMRFGWFSKAEKKAADKIEKFRASLRKIGYDVNDSIVDEIFKVEDEK